MSMIDGHHLSISHRAEACNADCDNEAEGKTVFCVGTVTVEYKEKKEGNVTENVKIVLSQAAETDNVSALTIIFIIVTSLCTYLS